MITMSFPQWVDLRLYTWLRRTSSRIETDEVAAGAGSKTGVYQDHASGRKATLEQSQGGPPPRLHSSLGRY
jgi:hypothetical protein